MNRNIIILVIFIFFAVNGVVYKVTGINAKERINMATSDSMKMLKTHYEILLHTQDLIAKELYSLTVEDDKFIDILSRARYVSKEKQAILRKEMINLLYKRYERAKRKGVLQYHFIFPDNTVFLRMHKPSKFGDNLTNIRDDFRYTNRTQKPIRGFTQGRTSHGFRNTFPIFDKNGTHIGAMEISFKSEDFQDYLTKISHIHTHFLVNKNIFNSKSWKRDSMILKYSQSAEKSNYMIAITKNHSQKRCIDDNIKKLEEIRDIIDTNMNKGDDFSTYIRDNNHIIIVSFLAIKNIKHKTVAWLVSYKENEFIKFTLNSLFYIRIFIFIFTLIILYFIILQINSKEELKSLHKDLEKRVIEALEKNIKQQEILQQQNKLAVMGEMIGAIAHQWRQPLNEIGLSIQNLKYDYKSNLIDEKFIEEFIDYNKKTILFMSRTIDDFRNFFRVDKAKDDFKIKEAINSVITMLSAQLKSNGIRVEIIGDEFIYNGLNREFQQVILNIINNAKDTLISNKIKNPLIKIELNYNKIIILDNGGGIPQNIIDRVFEPYFTTKEQGMGTGMGLYMSKMIIEDNMNGKLSVRNSKNMSIFIIDLKECNYDR